VIWAWWLTAVCRCLTASPQSVEAVTTSCDNFGRLSGARLKTPRRPRSRPLLSVAWTTVMCCAMASLMNWRTSNAIISRLCCGSCQLHWLPVWQRVVFKIATLIYQSLSSNAPGYLASDYQLVADAQQLHSADTRTLVSRTCSSFGYRTFAVTGHKSGTLCHPISDYVGWHTASSGNYWRHFYLDSEAVARCSVKCLTAPNRNILTCFWASTQV